MGEGVQAQAQHGGLLHGLAYLQTFLPLLYFSLQGAGEGTWKKTHGLVSPPTDFPTLPLEINFLRTFTFTSSTPPRLPVP